MKDTLRLFVGIALTVSAATGLLAQTPTQTPAPGMGAPPKVLQIFREEVKPGKSAAHQKYEMGWPKAYSKVNWPTNYLALTSVTGPSEAWFMTGYDSFAAWQKDRDNLEKNEALKNEDDRLAQGDSEFLSGARSIVASYREDLSTSAPVALPKMRYFRVLTFRVRPGHDSDFSDSAKMIKAAYEKANVQVPWATYQVASGMATPTYMVFLPMKSFDEIDSALMNGKKLQEAQGEENQKKMAKMAGDGYLTIESNIFAFDPKMSYPAKDFAAVDPEFWNPKPAPREKKGAEKPPKP